MATLTETVNDAFQSLLEQGQGIHDKYFHGSGSMNESPPRAEYSQWFTQVCNLVERVCGADSAHTRQIYKPSNHDSPALLPRVYGILEAANSDYKNGMLANIRHTVHAEISDDFLTQAEALYSQGYHVAAVSLAGAVLEDTLRTLCNKHSITYNPNKTSLEALNVELARAGIYDKLVQKRITAESDLRNSADHGHFDKVKPDDVEAMLRWVRRFVSEQLP